jgi:tRNA A-37 threonylcarbamoyl transferase component Bud32
MNVGHFLAIDEPGIGRCAACGLMLTQVGSIAECLRCLVRLGFSSDDQEPGEAGSSRRLTPGRLQYDRFEVDIGADGFPIELGAGAMATTYRARDTVLKSAVALKIIDRSVAQLPEVRSRFLCEAQAAARIRHPNVAHASHYGEQDGECFYVMELVEGETLAERVRRNGPMPPMLALEVIGQAARALAAAEACEIVHRDIKPSNIMIESDAAGSLVVKVIDYGVAKGLECDVEETQTGFMGTPAFASPEQLAVEGEARLDIRSDIYSLGVTFWYLLSGHAPFGGRTLEDIRAMQALPLPFEQLKYLRLPTECLLLVKRMLTPEPAGRPQSARELLCMVLRCQAKCSTAVRSSRRRSALVALGATLGVIALAARAWLSEPDPSSGQSGRPPDAGTISCVPDVKCRLGGNVSKGDGDKCLAAPLVVPCNSGHFWLATKECPKPRSPLATDCNRAVALSLQALLLPQGVPSCTPQEVKSEGQSISACHTSGRIAECVASRCDSLLGAEGRDLRQGD